MTHFRKLAATALLSAGFVAQADAALYTDSAAFGAVDEDFDHPYFDGLVVPPAWPELIGEPSGGLAALSSDIGMTLGAFGVDLNENGTWGAGNRFAGIGDLVNGTGDFEGSMFLRLWNPESYGVGALFSLYQDVGGTASITLEAFDSAFGLLESHSFSINFADPTLTNAGMFYGIGRAEGDIAAIRISGDGFVFDDLRIAYSPVPVPAALPLMLGGLGLVGVLRRRTAA
jgi:hypothetical protein